MGGGIHNRFWGGGRQQGQTHSSSHPKSLRDPRVCPNFVSPKGAPDTPKKAPQPSQKRKRSPPQFEGCGDLGTGILGYFGGGHNRFWGGGKHQGQTHSSSHPNASPLRDGAVPVLCPPLKKGAPEPPPQFEGCGNFGDFGVFWGNCGSIQGKGGRAKKTQKTKKHQNLPCSMELPVGDSSAPAPGGVGDTPCHPPSVPNCPLSPPRACGDHKG